MCTISPRKTQPSHHCWMSLGFREDYWTAPKIRIIPTSLDLYTEMPSLQTSHFPPLQLTKHYHGCNRRNNSWLTLIQQTSQTDSDRGIGLPLRRLLWVSSKRNHWNRILPHRDQSSSSCPCTSNHSWFNHHTHVQQAGLNWQIHLIRTFYA